MSRNILTNLSLLTLFTNKLHTLVKNADDFDTFEHIQLSRPNDAKNDISNGFHERLLTGNISLDQQQQNLISVITKQTVLTFMQIILIHIFLVSYFPNCRSQYPAVYCELSLATWNHFSSFLLQCFCKIRSK